MLTNIDLEKMNHLMETNKDAKEIITQLLKNHDAAVATIAHEIRNPMTVLYIVFDSFSVPNKIFYICHSVCNPTYWKCINYLFVVFPSSSCSGI